MTKDKIQCWGIELGKFIKDPNKKLKDPYIVDGSSRNAFDALQIMQDENLRQYNDLEIDYFDFTSRISDLQDLRKEFLKAEVKRITSPDFKPRFTEKLANEINQRENELLQR